jgi:hypothetical protein
MFQNSCCTTSNEAHIFLHYIPDILSQGAPGAAGQNFQAPIITYNNNDMIGQCTIHVVYLYVYINLCLYWSIVSIVNHIIVCAIQNVYAYNYTLNLPQCICCSCFIDRINHQSCPRDLTSGFFSCIPHIKTSIDPIFGGMKIYLPCPVIHLEITIFFWPIHSTCSTFSS